MLNRAVYHTQEHLILLQGQVDQQRAQLQKVQTKLQQEQEKARNSQKGFREIISEQIDRNSQVAMGVNQAWTLLLRRRIGSDIKCFHAGTAKHAPQDVGAGLFHPQSLCQLPTLHDIYTQHHSSAFPVRRE